MDNRKSRRTVQVKAASLSATTLYPNGAHSFSGSLGDGQINQEGSDYDYVDYSFRDRDVVEYGVYKLNQLPRVPFRGPKIDPFSAPTFFSCFGAAETLGVYAQYPFPSLLAGRINIPVWNAGIGGAVPSVFLGMPEFFAAANRGKFLILSVMSARHEANSRMEPLMRSGVLKDKRTGEILNAFEAWDRIRGEGSSVLKQCEEESRAAWIKGMDEIMKMVKVPVILFWFSRRSPNVDTSLDDPAGFKVDSFPQLIDQSVLDKLSFDSENMVICTSSRNVMNKHINRVTGGDVIIDHEDLNFQKSVVRATELKETHNAYYPSPEMHADAADVIFERICASGLCDF